MVGFHSPAFSILNSSHTVDEKLCNNSIHPLGKLGVFKAKVKGDPKPEVTWKRAKGTISDKDKYQSKYDKSTGEYILEVSD